jgi:hypothetical protein
VWEWNTDLASKCESAVNIEEYDGVFDRTVREQRNDTGGDGSHIVVMLGNLAKALNRGIGSRAEVRADVTNAP